MYGIYITIKLCNKKKKTEENRAFEGDGENRKRSKKVKHGSCRG
jgi:hypothetical protein